MTVTAVDRHRRSCSWQLPLDPAGLAGNDCNTDGWHSPIERYLIRPASRPQKRERRYAEHCVRIPESCVTPMMLSGGSGLPRMQEDNLPPLCRFEHVTR